MSCSPCSYTGAADPANETLPSSLSNFIADFYGSLTKTTVNGRVVWTLPCDLDTGLESNPRETGEGLACYFVRLIEDLATAGVGGPINVRDFGAVGDGVADDTAAIQAALDSAIISGIDAGGREVYVPQGTYNITQCLFLPSHLVFRVHGTIQSVQTGPNAGFYGWGRTIQNYLQPPGGDQTITGNKKTLNTTTGEPNSYVSENISILGDGIGKIIGLAKDGVEIYNPDRSVISGYRNVYLFLLFNVSNLCVRDLIIQGAKGWHLAIVGCRDVRVSGNTIRGGEGTSSVHRDGAFDDGIHLEATNRAAVFGNYVRTSDDNIAVSCELSGYFTNPSYGACRRIVVANNLLRQTCPTGALANGYLTSGNNFRLMAVSSTSTDVNHLKVVEDVHFVNNRCSTEAYGIYVEFNIALFSNIFPTVNPNRHLGIVVEGNTFDFTDALDGATSPGRFFEAFRVDHVALSRFQNNLIRGVRRQYVWKIHDAYRCEFVGNKYDSFGLNGYDTTGYLYTVFWFGPKVTNDAGRTQQITIRDEAYPTLVNSLVFTQYTNADVRRLVDQLTIRNVRVDGWATTGGPSPFYPLLQLNGLVDKTNRTSTLGRVKVEGCRFTGGKTQVLWCDLTDAATTPITGAFQEPDFEFKGSEFGDYATGAVSTAYGFRCRFVSGVGLTHPMGAFEFRDCTFRKLAGTAMIYDYCRKLVVRGCSFDRVALEATTLGARRAAIDWQLSAVLNTVELEGDISDNTFMPEGYGVRVWRIGASLNQNELVVVPYGLGAFSSTGMCGSLVFRYVNAASLTMAANNIPTTDVGGTWEKVRNGAIGLHVFAASSSSPYSGGRFRVENNRTFGLIGTEVFLDTARDLAVPPTFQVDSVPVNTWYARPGWRFQLTQPVAGGTEGVVCTSAGYIVREAWNVATAYNPADCVVNGANIYVAIAAVTGGAAPVHTSGDVGSWRFVIAGTAATLKAFGSVTS